MLPAIKVADDSGNVHSQDYLAAVCHYAQANNLLTVQQLATIQTDLWTLLSQQTERYTMGASSSVRVGVAQQLLQSICYCLGLYLQKNDTFLNSLKQLQTMSLREIFAKGQETLQQEVIVGKQLLLRAKRSRLAVDNLVYQELFKVMEDFYARYDSYFNAQGLPAMLDYPLYWPVENLLGVEYANEYLHRLFMEHTFCQKFSAKNLTSLWQVYCAGDEELIINLFEPVFINALVLAMLKKNVWALDVTKEDKQALFSFLQKHSKIDLPEKMLQAFADLCYQIKLEDLDAQQYLKKMLKDLQLRFTILDNLEVLDNMVISFNQAQEDFSGKAFVANRRLADEDLRKLIEEIGSCRYQQDKLLMLQQYVHNIEDFVSIIDVCFSGDEYKAVFALLGAAEIQVLHQYVLASYGQSLELVAEQPCWLIKFLQYRKNSK